MQEGYGNWASMAQGTPRHCDRRHVDPEVKHLTSAVRFDAVSKNFGSRVAVRELSLTIPEGTIYGFLGPNGAGKTTAMRLMLGIHLPDAGSLSVLGHADPRRVRERIGYLPEERGLYPRMQVL